MLGGADGPPNRKAAPTGSPDIVLPPQAVMTSSASNLGETPLIAERQAGGRMSRSRGSAL
jgi:hypothetical protein